ncbi:zinc finger and BTB domain-containing protein 32 [Neoarius graeffei]|uniref:zinc finger and BTB domain-containing protein 32 n=1 Tax=Neoarius graeffei TaxID=443677 RepID=UPI00298D16ED|nr:zinc finger and BTB domain-containing protein 32 [Neoarius graeffei]XP_060753674.1 zinc finger and BTB domain-containing protein 32 [Neoarius graeffei]XP_060753675.1 zinc finger and BTB domain-containing protein 32 [Neoarius graeffei]XP_060753676.1 zinc finger and BTB domain-containing protein 32 [Neoarius graeffei]XP_060753677.1 zinc finger and BTB domain-containing protein 32 [Neoarius graeffei]
MIRLHNPHPLPFLHQTERFLRAGTLCDTTLTVDGYAFKAHALVLSWASKTLQRQLINQNPAKGYCCTVDGVSPQTVKQILDYVYSACIEVPKGDLPALLRGAHHLEMQSLMEQCELQMGFQDRVKGIEEERSSPDIDVGECDSRKKIPSSDEVSVSSSLESPSLTHFDHERSQRVASLSPTPQKPPLSITVASPTASREPASSTSSLAQTPPLNWPPINPSRHMVLTYTDIMAFQHMVACSYPTPMYPFLQHSLQHQIPSSLMGYTGLLHPHQHLIYPRPVTLDNPVVPEVKRKTDHISALLPGAASQERERKSKQQSDKERHCRHCSKPVVENWRQSARSASPGLEELLHECKFCQRGVKEKRSLRSLRRGHGGEKPYQCKHCNKRFSLKHQLDTHLRVHTGEKPFECRLCGQRSRDYSAMIKHLRTHGGATPYQCTLCLEFCSSLVTMQKHLKSHPSQDFPPNWSLSSTYLYTCHA